MALHKRHIFKPINNSGTIPESLVYSTWSLGGGGLDPSRENRAVAVVH